MENGGLSPWMSSKVQENWLIVFLVRESNTLMQSVQVLNGTVMLSCATMSSCATMWSCTTTIAKCWRNWLHYCVRFLSRTKDCQRHGTTTSVIFCHQHWQPTKQNVWQVTMLTICYQSLGLHRVHSFCTSFLPQAAKYTIGQCAPLVPPLLWASLVHNIALCELTNIKLACAGGMTQLNDSPQKSRRWINVNAFCSIVARK